MTNNFQESYYEFKMKISFGVFFTYFRGKKDFKNFLATLSKEKQEKFFRLSKFYNDFIRNPFFKDENTKRFFSLIMIFSLIEATVSEEKHKTFDEYLVKNFEPILDKETLKDIQRKYLNKFGVRRQIKKFFDDYVDEECKKIFANAICFNSGNKRKALSIDENIKKNIDIFYQWRSEFVHNAEIHGAFSGSSFCVVNKNVITTAYRREDFEQLFEHGFLRYFGYTKNLEHKDIKKKIEQYKKYTFSVAWKRISNDFESLKKLINKSI
ncbi:MAG: hypothetical protein U9O55_00940 [Patescibacteria group bacterium]|nr:hypothetical protein [Patescibacteria group bacterium]